MSKPYCKLLGKNKEFDENLYNKYDVPARELMKKCLGDFVKDNPDIYNEDMILEHPDLKYKYLELQVCAHWKYQDYPYKKPFVFERKGHFSDDTLYIIFSQDFSQGLLFDKKSLNPTPKRKKKYSRTFIYDVEWFRVMRLYFDNFSIETLLLY
jgi:hypothetical protein